MSSQSSGEEHAEQLVGLSRIQRLMLSLMPKYCSTNNWKLLLKEIEKKLVRQYTLVELFMLLLTLLLIA